MTTTWISRQENKDGILCVECKEVDRKKPIHWIFGGDISESMLSNLKGEHQHLTRWDVARQLLDQIHADVAKCRENDVVSLLVFNTKVTVVCKAVPVRDIASISVVLDSEAIKPSGRTNIGNLTTAIQTLVSTDEGLKTGKFDMVELTFTDGIANEGFTNNYDLIRQKKECLEHFQSKYGLTPFVWSGAISRSARWDLAKGMAGCSVFGTWAHIKETEISQFAAEVGGVVSTVLNSSICHVDIPLESPAPGADVLYMKKAVLVMGTTPNYFYFKTKPVNLDDVKEQECPPLVSVFKIQAMLNEVDSGKMDLTLDDLKELKEKLLSRKSTDDPFIYESESVTTEFERVKTHCLDVVGRMIELAEANQLLSAIPMDLGLVRTTSSNNDHVQSGRDKYTSAYRQYSAAKKKASPKKAGDPLPCPLQLNRTKVAFALPDPLPSAYSTFQ